MSAEEYPKELKYNKDYSWVKKDGDRVSVGIISPSAKKVKEFVFIKLPEKEKDIKRGDTYVSVEAVKWSGHLSSPVSGKITEVNEALFDEPAKINEDPYGSWIMKVELKDPEEFDGLMDSEEAKKYYEEER